MYPVGHCLEVASAACLVAQRPDHDAWTVLVPLHHAFDPVETILRPFRQARRDDVPDAMGFQVRFVDNVDAVLVTKIIPPWVIRIVACPHSIDVKPLHDLYVLHQAIIAQRFPIVRIDFMTVHPLEEDRHAVDLHLAANQLK